jgi:outer membrane lipoprotein-sorting protein
MGSRLPAIILLLAVLGAAGAARAGDQPQLPVERLDKIITGAPDHTAKFREERRLKMLNEPLHLEGTLRFRAPDHLEEHTLSPQRENLVVDGEWVTVSAPGRKNEMRLNMGDDPVLQGLLFSLQSLLAGKPERLSEIFKVEAKGSASGWILRLKPLKPEMADRVQIVRVTGEGPWIRTLELWQANGDYLVMTIYGERPE